MTSVYDAVRSRLASRTPSSQRDDNDNDSDYDNDNDDGYLPWMASVYDVVWSRLEPKTPLSQRDDNDNDNDSNYDYDNDSGYYLEWHQFMMQYDPGRHPGHHHHEVAQDRQSSEYTKKVLKRLIPKISAYF